MKPAQLLPRHVAPLVDEHAALCRKLAGLQRRVSDLLSQHENEICRLDRETLRLRGQLLVARTALLWGLDRGVARQAQATRPSRRAEPGLRTPTLPEARDVLCQVACAGHAHPWLDTQGQCSRDGQACSRWSD